MHKNLSKIPEPCLKGLLSLLDNLAIGVVPLPKEGICGHMSRSIDSWNGYDDLYSKSAFQAWMQMQYSTWEGYSGNSMYPVIPSGAASMAHWKGRASVAFEDDKRHGRLWQGTVGADRKALALHIAAALRQELKS
jgi:hypothetical protein